MINATPSAQTRARFERDYRRARARRHWGTALGATLLLAALVIFSNQTQFNFARLYEGAPRIFGFFASAFPHLEGGALFANAKTNGSFAYWYYDAGRWATLLFESIQMAILATVLGFFGGFLLSFLAARTLSPHYAIFFVFRRFLELLRTVPDIVMALLFVYAFGIGPLAGILAIALHTTGALGKLFAEVNENIEPGPLEGVRAAGGNLLQTICYGVLPQVMPNFASYTLLRFEINVGAAAAIGLVGAGGIGQELNTVINFGLFRDASAIMLMIVAVIFAIDLTSERIRHRFIGLAASA